MNQLKKCNWLETHVIMLHSWWKLASTSRPFPEKEAHLSFYGVNSKTISGRDLLTDRHFSDVQELEDAEAVVMSWDLYYYYFAISVVDVLTSTRKQGPCPKEFTI